MRGEMVFSAEVLLRLPRCSRLTFVVLAACREEGACETD